LKLSVGSREVLETKYLGLLSEVFGLSDSDPEEKKVTAANVAIAVCAVAIVQLVALLISYQNLPVFKVIINATGPVNPVGGLTGGGNGTAATAESTAGNAVFFVGLAFVLTLGLVWLLRTKRVNVFKLIIFASVAIASFVITMLTADVFAFNYLPQSDLVQTVFVYGVPFALVVLIGYVIFVKNVVWLATGILAFVGAEVGSFFAEALPPLTALVLPGAFALYDIYAVFRGPLKQLVGTAPNIALVGMSIKAGVFTLGLGDVVFYTMLPSLALLKAGYAAALATILAIDVGVIATLVLLTRRKLLPGLPIPMFLGILVLLYYFL
jgi:hypothetical protein